MFNKIIIFYITICLIYLIIYIKYKGFQEGFYRFLLVLFLPVFGFLYFFITDIGQKIIKKSDTIVNSYTRYIEDHSQVDYVEKINFEKDLNTIPVEDSLYFDKSKDKRSYLIYILKKNYIGHIKGLIKATKNKDTETAHYAAAALMEIKNQFEIMLNSAKHEYYNHKNDIVSIRKYIDILKKFLNSSLPDESDYNQYLREYSSLLEKLLSIYKKDKQYFSDKISTDIDLAQFDSAQRYCQEFYNLFPNDEKPYLKFMEFYYYSNNQDSFIEKLNALKNKNIDLTDHTKGIINYWERANLNVY